MKKILSIMLLCYGFLATMQCQASGVDFMNNLGRRTVETLINAQKSQAEIESDFEKIFCESFDVNAIASFLGSFKEFRAWDKMNEDQKSRFRNIVVKRIVKSYASRFQDYKGVVFTPTKEMPASDPIFGSVIVVESTLKKPNESSPTEVNWKLFNGKIVDVVIKSAGSISMLITIRDDYKSALKNALLVSGDNAVIEAFLGSLTR